MLPCPFYHISVEIAKIKAGGAGEDYAIDYFGIL